MPSPAIRIEGDIAYVALTRGYEAIIDVEDVSLVESFNWTALIDRRKDGSVRRVYAVRKEGFGKSRRSVLMHRTIGKTPHGLDTDHHDGDGLNNRKINLRSATVAQNAHNQGLSISNTSGHKGVHWNKRRGMWQARIRVPGERRHIGYYRCKTAAAIAYAKKSLELHGDFGRVA